MIIKILFFNKNTLYFNLTSMGRRGHDRTEVGFTTASAFSAYHY